MTKILLKFLSLFAIVIFILISYFSVIGFETKKFNDLIKNNLKSIDKRIDSNFNNLKLLLDPFSFSLNIKTFGPTIYYNNKELELEYIKSQIPLKSLLKKNISSSNIIISTKLLKINDVISFVNSIKNSPKISIINGLIDKGFLIADINLNFDDNGKIKDNFQIKGIIKDSELKLINKNKIENINFNFDIQNKNIVFNDINLMYGKIKFLSDRFILTEEKEDFLISGKFINSKTSLNENEVKKYINFDENFEIKKINFSSINNIQARFSNKFKLQDYEFKSSLNLEDLILNNFIKLKYFFPEMKEIIPLKNNKINFIKTKTSFNLEGKGKVKFQNEYDEFNYKLKKEDNDYIFDTKINIINNPIFIDFLNFKTSDKIETKLNITGKYRKDKNLILKEIKLINDKNIVKINDLELNNDYKISSINSAEIDLIDEFEKKNQLIINKDKEYYNIYSKSFNASVFLNDLLTKNDEKDLNLFDKKFNLKVNFNKLFVNENDFINNFKGNLSLENNIIDEANLEGLFSKNQNISFTVIKKDGQKVTTFFSDKAQPFVKKFEFIKGFDGGSLDFYSVETEKTSNSQIKLYDFKLKEVPALTKILTLASLQGIADLLSGEGIRFDDFEMKFQNENNLMKIDEIYAIGPAISILMEGYIEKNNLVSLRGTLVPATTINKAIGSIPILGEILVGKKTGEGVFGVSFKIKGPPSETETTVNPIKTLTPRFITRTLEKIKKN